MKPTSRPHPPINETKRLALEANAETKRTDAIVAARRAVTNSATSPPPTVVRSSRENMALLDGLYAELGTPARTISDSVFSIPSFAAAMGGERMAPGASAMPFRNLLLTDPGTGRTAPAVARPRRVSTPILDAITVIDGVDIVLPTTVEYVDAADVAAEGDVSGESELAYTTDANAQLATISHHLNVTRQALRHQRQLRADLDTFLTAGVLFRCEALVMEALVGSAGTVAHPYDTSVTKTLRTAVAAAQNAFPELGSAPIAAFLSPIDHAVLDYETPNRAEWPAEVLSSPKVPSGFAYVGPMSLAVQFFATIIDVSVGTINSQFTENTATVQASTDAYAHIAAPTAIVKADLTA